MNIKDRLDFYRVAIGIDNAIGRYNHALSKLGLSTHAPHLFLHFLSAGGLLFVRHIYIDRVRGKVYVNRAPVPLNDGPDEVERQSTETGFFASCPDVWVLVLHVFVQSFARFDN